MTKRAGLARAMLVLWGVLLCAPAQADAIFVVFEGPAAGALPVKGAALDDEMAKLGALEVDSLDFGIENSLVIDPREGATGPGRAAFLPLRMVLALGPGVPALLQTAGAGGHYGDVTVHFRTGGRQAGRPRDPGAQARGGHGRRGLGRRRRAAGQGHADLRLDEARRLSRGRQRRGCQDPRDRPVERDDRHRRLCHGAEAMMPESPPAARFSWPDRLRQQSRRSGSPIRRAERAS